MGIPAAHSQAWASTHQITYYQGNKPAAISLTFDDGYRSQVTLGISQLNARGLKGTFFMVTDPDYVNSNVTWAVWRSVAAQGHDVQCHTVTHPELTAISDSEVRWEFSQSLTDVSQNLGQPCITMAYPYTHSNISVRAIASEFYIAARGGFVDPIYPNHYLNYYQAGSDRNGSWNAINFYNIASLQGDNLGSNNQYLTDRQFNDSLDMAVQRHGWFTLFFHYIDDSTTLGNIIDYIQDRGDYWIDTFSNVARYMKERLNTTIQILMDTPAEIRLRLVMDSSLPASIYNVPLTIRSTVPASWGQVIVQQGGSIQTLVPVLEAGEKVVYYNALPNGGDVVLLSMPYPVPGLTSLNPASVFAGGSAFTLTVTGNNFVGSSIVRWNNSDRPTTYVSATQLTASIPASDIASVGTANVRVFNPAPGGGSSNQLPFSIVARPVTVTVNPGQSKIYGDADPAFSYTASDPAVTFTGSLSRAPGENTGAYPIRQGTLAVANNNYVIASFVPADFSIAKRPAYVTPDAAGKTFGEADPSFTGTLSGFVPADNVTAAYSRDAGESVAGSPYTISAALSPAGVLANYDVTYNTADFTINPLIATVTLSGLNHLYDGTAKSATAITDPPGLPVDLTYNGSSSAPQKAGSYTVTATVNYPNYVGVATGTLFIDKVVVDPAITAEDKTYDGTIGAVINTRNLSGVIGVDVVNLTGGMAVFADKKAGNGKPVTVTGLTLSGADADNYGLSTTSADTTADIKPRVLTITATGVDKVYDGTTTAVVMLADDRVAGDDLTTNYAAASFSDPNVGLDKTVSVSGIAITGGSDSGNYILGNTTTVATADIAIAGQTITVTRSAPATAPEGSSFEVAATASSGLPVAISTAGVCTGKGDGTATVTMTSGFGTCNVLYNQAGNINYGSAATVQEDVKATQRPSITSAARTTFDIGFMGAFTVTTTGNPAVPMLIFANGILPPGVTFTDNGDGTATLSGIPTTAGTYRIAITADNGVPPNAKQDFTLTVRNGPVIGAIGSAPNTDNGSIVESEVILDTLGIRQITVEFSQDVNNPPLDTDPKDVTNPANYILVLGSSTGVFQTVSCSEGVVEPDVPIAVDGVTYSNGDGSGPFVATLNINGGLPLNASGYYRLYVCGTTSIVDAVNVGLELAGDGVNPGTDFFRSFRIQSRVISDKDGKSAKSPGAANLNIPITGFAPGRITLLSVQPADKAYKSLGELRIEIPTLGINFPIVGAALDEAGWDLSWLKDSVAYLEGSAYPTLPGNTVLTAHVTDAYNNLGPFSDINGMQMGQKIYIHANGLVYVYQVQENRKILPSNISAVFAHEEYDWVTLVTCEDYSAKTGSYKYRRMVRAVLVSVVPEK